MDDLDVIRFAAMDIMTNPPYHAPSRRKSQFFTQLSREPREKRLMPVPTFFLSRDWGVFEKA